MRQNIERLQQTQAEVSSSVLWSSWEVTHLVICHCTVDGVYVSIPHILRVVGVTEWWILHPSFPRFSILSCWYTNWSCAQSTLSYCQSIALFVFLFLDPSVPPCWMVLARLPYHLITWPNHCNFLIITVVNRCSCLPIYLSVSCRTCLLVV